METIDMNYTYILLCKDGSLYCGWTNDLKKRLASHNAGKGAKYTRSRHPVTLVYFESFDTKEEAMSREFAIKKMPRSGKLKLIEAFDRTGLVEFTDSKSQTVLQDSHLL